TFMALGVTLVFVIRLIADKVRIWTDKKFFRDAYDSEQILSELSEEVRSMVEIQPLFETLSTKISESLHVPQIAMLLKEGGHFRPAYALGYSDVPEVLLAEDAPPVAELKKDDHLIIDETDPDEDTVEKEELKELNSRLL